MIRTIQGLGLAMVLLLLLGPSVRAGELDAEFGPTRGAGAEDVAAVDSVPAVSGTEMDAEAPVGAWHHGFGGFRRGFGGFGFGGFGRGFGFGGFGYGRGFGFGGYGLGLGYGGYGFGGYGLGLGYGGYGLGYGLGGYGLGGYYGGYSPLVYYSPFMSYGYGYGCW